MKSPLLLALGGKPPSSKGEGGEDMKSEAKQMAMEDFASSMKSGDHKSMAEAFKRAYDLCAMESTDYEE